MQSLLTGYLKTHDHQVARCGTAAAALAAVRTQPFDLLLLDLELPDEDGLVVARQARTITDCAIIFVTARGTLGDKVAGLGIGGDDYITKPFELEELGARITSVLRRSRPDTQDKQFRGADFTLDVTRRRAFAASGEGIDLTNAEFNVIAALAAAKGRVLSREQLLDGLGAHEDSGERTVDVIVSRIRKKLSQAGVSSTIRTVTGHGYSLDGLS